MLSGKAYPEGTQKMRGMREFIPINDRLSTFLTLHESERAFVQRSHRSFFRHERVGLGLFLVFKRRAIAWQVLEVWDRFSVDLTG